MKIIITRDSVCAADDTSAPNQFELTLDDDASIQDIVTRIAWSSQMPKIAGGKATWSVVSKEIIAVIAQSWKDPRMTNFIEPNIEELDFENGTLKVHLNYYSQMKPDVVFEVLEQTKLKL